MPEIVPPTRTTDTGEPPDSITAPSPWLTAQEAAARAKVGSKTIYREVRSGRLRAARIGGRRELRFLPAWIDQWLEKTTEAADVPRGTVRVAR